MKKFNLYVVTTEPKKGVSYEKMVEDVIKGGADVIQYRDTSSRLDSERIRLLKNLKKITKHYNIPLIVNNRLDLALITDADGVHVGQDDISVEEIYSLCKKVGRKLLVGLSTHSVKQAFEAEKKGVDYIGIGPVFATPTKPDYQDIGVDVAEEVFRTVKIPAVAIGGINEDNVCMLTKKGINRIAVVRAVCLADNIEQATRRLKDKLIKQEDLKQYE